MRTSSKAAFPIMQNSFCLLVTRNTSSRMARTHWAARVVSLEIDVQELESPLGVFLLDRIGERPAAAHIDDLLEVGLGPSRVAEG